MKEEKTVSFPKILEIKTVEFDREGFWPQDSKNLFIPWKEIRIVLLLCFFSITGRAEVIIRITGEVREPGVHHYQEAPVLMDPLRDSGGTTRLAAFLFIWRSNENGFQLIDFRIRQLSDDRKFYLPLKDGDWGHVMFAPVLGRRISE